MKLLLATRNPGKTREIRAILGDLPFDWLTLEDFPDYEEPEETGETFEENAVAKALAAAKSLGLPTLGDDSGLEIDALGGAPGLKSARFAPECKTQAEKNRKILDMMKDVSKPLRGARFFCVAALAFPDGRIVVAEGTCSGEVAYEPSGSEGFGYDPIFYIPERSCTVAELPSEEKNRLSHRAKALLGLRDQLLRIPVYPPA
ncbi:MAG: RdgB/HAM1 family non-canonical purine NTP pyrophosphatase [Armatimonadetes bacterium]|nr:RdgB/HAM1 family non-canonical purine NTP pyrophosphatase [Armatimonadota bacterium]